MRKMHHLHFVFALLLLLFAVGCQRNDVKTITIMFDSTGGSEVGSIKINNGETPSKPIDPVKNGYSFAGWFLDDILYDFTDVPSADVVLKAKWVAKKYKLIIKYGDGTTDDSVSEIEYGAKISIDAPTRTGYTFNGWDKEIPETMPAEDLIITASWKASNYTIIVKYNDGVTEDLIISQDYNTAIEAIDAPTRTGYTFNGCDKEIPETMPLEGLEINALWQVNKYILTIKYNDGTTGDLVSKIEYGAELEITNPTMAGYTFDKWDKVIPETMPAEDLTINASWKINKYSLTIKYNDGVTKDLVISQDYNTAIEAIDDPTRTGYTFNGWDKEIPETMPAEDLTITASWETTIYTLSFYENDVLIRSIDVEYGQNVTIGSEVQDMFYIFLDDFADYNDGDELIYNYETNLRINVIEKDQLDKYSYYADDYTKTISITGVMDSNIRRSALCERYLINDEEYSVTSIGYFAFYHCTSLTSITIPNSVTSIGGSAFNDCTSLTSITIPDSVTSIGTEAFYNCYNLTSIIIPDSVTSIGDRAFFECYRLVEIVNKSSLQLELGSSDYGNLAYYAKQIITDEADSKLSTTNDGFVFYNDNYDVYLISYIGNNVEIVIPNNATIINKNAFSSCTSLTSITIPDSVTFIDSSAFYNCTSLTSIVVDENNLVYDSRDNCNAIINSSNNELIVSCLGTTIPESVTSIGDYAFAWCTSLTNITIPGSVTSIGVSAFRGCTALTSIIIPDSVTFIDSSAFYDCENLIFNEYDNAYYLGNSDNPYVALVKAKDGSIHSCEINSNCRLILNSAFGGCTSLTSITIPDSVTSIGTEAFYNCTSLSHVYINDLESWCNISFSGYVSNPMYYSHSLYLNGELLTELIIPNTITEIKDYCFAACGSIRKAIIPDSVTRIGYQSFRYCDHMTSLTLGRNVTIINSDAFINCYRLVEIINNSNLLLFPNTAGVGNLTTYAKQIITSEAYSKLLTTNDGHVLYLDNEEVYYIDYIGNERFVELPSSVTIINDYALRHIKQLNKVIIPKNVKKIGTEAFGYCYALFEVINKSSLPLASGISGYGEIGKYAQRITNVDNDNSIVTTDDGFIIYDDGDKVYLLDYVGEETDIVIPNYVDEIYNYVLYESQTITSVIIPNSVSKVGERAFDNCPNLIYKEENGLYYLGNEDNPYLVLMKTTSNSDLDCYINENCKIIGSRAFDGKRFQSVIIPDNVVTIGPRAFYYSNVQNVLIGCGVETIDYQAFYYSSIESIVIPNSVKTIGFQAFGYCSSLTSIIVGNSVESIGFDGFRGCTALTSIALPDSLVFLGAEAFANCTRLESVSIGNGLASLIDETFYGCKALTNVLLGSGMRIVDDFAFGDCTALTNVVIPNGTEVLGIRAFCGCTSLESISLPNTLIAIEENAFSGCLSLTTITIPSSVQTIGKTAFRGCHSLEEVIFQNGVKSIGESAFYDCRSITSIYIPSSVISIDKLAFSNCPLLTSIVVDPNNQALDSRNNCNAVIETATNTLLVSCENTVIPNDVEIIGSCAFQDASYLTNVVLPSGVTAIGEYAFYNCKSLSSITIPNTVTEIEQYAFGYCTALNNVVVPDGVISINEGVFSDCFALTNITLPSALVSIDKQAFGGCKRLVSICLPSTLESIGDDAFTYCTRLESIVLPNGITNIGQYAFNYCGMLNSISYLGLSDEWDLVSKGIHWHDYVKTNYVECADANIVLESEVDEADLLLFAFLSDLNSSAIALGFIDSDVNPSQFYSTFAYILIGKGNDQYDWNSHEQGIFDLDSQLVVRWRWLIELSQTKHLTNKRLKGACNRIGVSYNYSTSYSVDVYAVEMFTNNIHNLLTFTGEHLHRGSAEYYPAGDWSDVEMTKLLIMNAFNNANF